MPSSETLNLVYDFSTVAYQASTKPVLEIDGNSKFYVSSAARQTESIGYSQNWASSKVAWVAYSLPDFADSPLVSLVEAVWKTMTVLSPFKESDDQVTTNETV